MSSYLAWQEANKSCLMRSARTSSSWTEWGTNTIKIVLPGNILCFIRSYFSEIIQVKNPVLYLVEETGFFLAVRNSLGNAICIFVGSAVKSDEIFGATS